MLVYAIESIEMHLAKRSVGTLLRWQHASGDVPNPLQRLRGMNSPYHNCVLKQAILIGKVEV